MNDLPPSLLADSYKIHHPEQYPPDTEVVYSTWIPRASRMPGIDHVVAFGFQSFIQRFLIEYFGQHFFARPERGVRVEYERFLHFALGVPDPDSSRLGALHRLGYLPLSIRAVPEGTLVPLRVPMLTIENTRPEFYWLTNFIETLFSCEVWAPSTQATIAWQYRKMLQDYARRTNGDTSFVPYQGHDFSMRGMSSLSTAANAGIGHLLSFVGTDTIPAVLQAERYYGANIETELVGGSVPATEHSVQCAYGRDELSSYRRLLTEVYPSGIVSIVSDTWDLWEVLDKVIRELKDVILARDGRCVIRPDSGVPADIICGDPHSANEFEQKGVIEILWDIFGGEITPMGYKQLDPHIGAIYGDAISLNVCYDICERLMAKGFASTNMVYGIGSFTYQWLTRDVFGFALKSTYVERAGMPINIYKDPVTDKDKTKKSLTGRVVVIDKPMGTARRLNVIDGLSRDEQAEWADQDILAPVFLDGKLVRRQSLSDIRAILLANL